MRFHTPAILFACCAIMVPQPGLAEQRCDPPHQDCGGRDGISYPCPPCRPDLDKANGAAFEDYRGKLEVYREQLEVTRRADPGGTLDGYRKGIDAYRHGIDRYRNGQAAQPDKGAE